MSLNFDKTNKQKVKSSKVTSALPLNKQGKLRWCFEFSDGSVMDKYNGENEKNVYVSREGSRAKVNVDVKNVKNLALFDWQGKLATVMTVPEGGVAFQRRRVIDINYYGRTATAKQDVGDKMIAGRWVPKKTLTKTVPIYDYGDCWLAGYRKRETDGSLTVKYKCVYPDGKVEEFNVWGVKGWLKEPEWFLEELVDDEDKEAQLDRLAAKNLKDIMSPRNKLFSSMTGTPKEKMKQHLGWT